MKIVNRKTFLALPAGTIYSKHSDGGFGQVAKKYDTWTNDWLYQEISDFFPGQSSEENFAIFEKMVKEGTSLPLTLDSSSRDGLFENDELFAIYDEADIQTMVNFLLGNASNGY